MVFDFHNKFIFQHIFKNGGTSVTNALQTYRIPDQEILSTWVNKKDHVSQGNVLALEFGNHHIVFDQFHAIWPKFNFDEYFKFCFVRNTYDWIISGYKYCCGINYFKNYPEDIRIQKAKEFTLEFYIKNWILPDYSQWDFMTFRGNLIMDYIGRFENLQEDFNKITDIIGLPRKTLNRLNPGDQVQFVLPEIAAKANQHYSLWYNDELIELVTKYAKKEIDYFNFKFEDKR